MIVMQRVSGVDFQRVDDNGQPYQCTREQGHDGEHASPVSTWNVAPTEPSTPKRIYDAETKTWNWV